MTDHRDPYDIDHISVPIDQLSVPPAPPRIDTDSRHLLDQLITTLVDLRFPLCSNDAAARLHILASLQADIAARLPEITADALHQDYTWDQIATSLGTSPAAARSHHMPHVPRTRHAL